MFCLRNTSEIKDENAFSLSVDNILSINPNTRTCPIFRNKTDAEITKKIYENSQVLINDEKNTDPWGIKYLRMFDMTNDSGLFRTKEELENKGLRLEGNIFVKDTEKYLPLYEAKMFHIYDHRFADSEKANSGMQIRAASEYLNIKEKNIPSRLCSPRYWVEEKEVIRRVNENKWEYKWFLSFRDITGNVANVRTSVFSVIPWSAQGNTAPILISQKKPKTIMCLVAMFSSYVFDFTSRMKVGGTHLNYYILKQLPVISPDKYENEILNFICPRVTELVYTAYDLKPFAEDCGYNGPPFKWNEERRFLSRCELDAAYFHLYGINRDDVDYIMETFPIVKRKDGEKYREYKTKRVILEIYDEMAEAMRTGKFYQTRLDPPPADPRVAHQPKR